MSALALLAAALAAAGPPGLPPPGPDRPVVEAVRLVVPPGEDAAPLERLVAVRAGEPLAVADLRRTVQALYQTGRFGNVIVRAWPAEGPGGASRVRLEVQCLPRRVVASVRVTAAEGTPLPAEAILQAAALPRGAELYPGRLEIAAAEVRRALWRKGWREARVRATAQGEVQAAVLVEVEPGTPTRVASLALGPETGIPADDLRKGLSLQVGAVLDEDALAADVREVRDRLRKAGYYRARVGSPVVTAAAGEGTVALSVEAGPRLSFSFAGDLPLPAAQLRERLGYEGEVPLDETAVEGAAERLREFLGALGFAEARVWTEESGDARRVTVLFHVDAGRRYELRDVRFTGGTFRDEGWLRDALVDGLEALPPLEVPQPRADLDAMALASGLPVKDPVEPLPTSAARTWEAAAWAKVLQQIADGYRAEGFLDARLEVASATLDAREGFVDVAVRVREGVRTLVDEVAVEGGELEAAALLERSRVKAGAPLSLVAVEETRRSIADAYLRKGYVYVRVAAAETYAPDRTRASVRYRVEPGPQVRISAVIVEGNKRTRTVLVERTLGIRAGQVYDPVEAANAQTELLRLGVFRTVTLQLSDPDVPQESKELLVQVDERPYQTLTATAGLSFAEGPRAAVEYGRPNLGGNALELITRLRVNYPLEIFRPDLVVYAPYERIEWLAEAGVRLPRVLEVRFVNFRADLVAQHKIQAAYELTRGALILGADVARLGPFSTSLTASVEVDEVGSKTACQSTFCLEASPEKARYLFPVGLTTLFSLQPRLSLDFRDNAARPTRGAFAEVIADYSRSLGSEGARFLGIPGSEVYVNLVRLEALLTGYLPVWKAVLAVSARVGRVFALDPASQTIGPKRFYLGGATTMRGYGVNEMIPQDVRPLVAEQTRICASSLSGLGCSPEQARLVQDGIMLPSEGGQVFGLLKAELRVPLTQATELGIFADWGNLWLDPVKVDLAMIRTNVGVGLRILTPVGPVAFDVGFNLFPEKAINEPVLAPHFAVGFF